MTVKVMLDAGLTDFQISIGHVGFFQALAEEAALSEDVLNELKELISIKNHFGAEELLAKQNLRSDLFEALRDVPQLFGNAEILEKAKGLTRNPAAREALDRLATIYEIVKDYGYEKYVFFDLGLLSKFHYYTGIIFRILYCHGISDECTGAPENFSSDCQYENDAALPGFSSAAGRKTCQRAQKQGHGCRAGLLCKGQGSCRL